MYLFDVRLDAGWPRCGSREYTAAYVFHRRCTGWTRWENTTGFFATCRGCGVRYAARERKG